MTAATDVAAPSIATPFIATVGSVLVLADVIDALAERVGRREVFANADSLHSDCVRALRR